MNVFVESPWPAIALGLVVEAVLAMILIQTGRAKVIAAMVAVAVVVAGLVVFERVIVTDREEVEDSLANIATLLEANNPSSVVPMFCDDSPRRREVQTILSRVTVREARIGGDLEIHLNLNSSPPTATTTFTGRVAARDNKGEIPYENVIRRFSVTLHREGDRWKVFDYQDRDVQASGPKL